MLTQQRVAPPGAPRYTALSTSSAPRRAATAPSVEKNDAEYFRPGGRDPLFWCFQVGMGVTPGLDARQERGYQREQSLKIEAVERIRQVSSAHTPAAKKKLQELESELTSRAFTRGNGLSALATAYGKRLLYVSGNTCCFMGPTEVEPDMIIRRLGSRNSRRHEVYSGDQTKEIVEACVSSLWCMECWEKPLRGVSTYTAADLRTMAARAGLATTTENGKNLTKVALHGALRATAVQN